MPFDEWRPINSRVDPIELLMTHACSMDLAGQLVAKRGIAAMRAVPPPRNAQGERDLLLRSLRMERYVESSNRDAAQQMSDDAKHVRFDRIAPLSQPQCTLHRIGVLNGGEFPSVETIRKVISGTIKGAVG